AIGGSDANAESVLPTPDGRLLFVTPAAVDALTDQGAGGGTVARLESEPAGITATGATLGPDGYLYLAESGTATNNSLAPGLIARVNSKGRRTLLTASLAGQPDQIVTGADGAL